MLEPKGPVQSSFYTIKLRAWSNKCNLVRQQKQLTCGMRVKKLSLAYTYCSFQFWSCLPVFLKWSVSLPSTRYHAKNLQVYQPTIHPSIMPFVFLLSLPLLFHKALRAIWEEEKQFINSLHHIILHLNESNRFLIDSDQLRKQVDDHKVGTRLRRR